MQTQVIQTRALILTEQLSVDLAEGRTYSERINAFGALARVTSLLSKPREEDIQLVYRERRYEPFWHIVCSASASYRRRRQYPIAIKAPEVRMVSIEGKEYPVSNGQFVQEGIEYCESQSRQEVFIDGLTARPQPNLANYLRYPAIEIDTNDLTAFAPEGSLVLPPVTPASTLVRDILAGIVQSVEADEILNEQVTVERVDIYWRPIYAFGFRWVPRNRDGVLECDAMTGEFRGGGVTHPDMQTERLYAAAVLDIDPNTVAQFVPGGHVVALSTQHAAEQPSEPEPPAPAPQPSATETTQSPDMPEQPVVPEQDEGWQGPSTASTP
ncbi:MAG: hypothetical protein ACYC4R_02900 [Anaerolineae bacterium]